MGGKRAGKRKQIYLCLAILIVLSLSACTFSKMSDTKIVSTDTIFSTKEGTAREYLLLGQKFLAQGDYGNALRENNKVFSLFGDKAPADEAHFFIGLIYAYPANPAKDQGKAMLSFKKLIKDHPKSPFVEQAKAVVGLLQDNDKLNRTIEQLNSVIEELKKVDISVEEKKRQKVR